MVLWVKIVDNDFSGAFPRPAATSSFTSCSSAALNRSMTWFPLFIVTYSNQCLYIAIWICKQWKMFITIVQRIVQQIFMVYYALKLILFFLYTKNSMLCKRSLLDWLAVRVLCHVEYRRLIHIKEGTRDREDQSALKRDSTKPLVCLVIIFGWRNKREQYEVWLRFFAESPQIARSVSCERWSDHMAHEESCGLNIKADICILYRRQR